MPKRVTAWCSCPGQTALAGSKGSKTRNADTSTALRAFQAFIRAGSCLRQRDVVDARVFSPLEQSQSVNHGSWKMLSSQAVTNPILDHWTSCPTGSSETLIFPDGCRDVILRRQPGERWEWLLSELDDSARSVTVSAGSEYIGRRLQPGVGVDLDALSRALQGISAENVSASRIAECCTTDLRTEELLSVLAQGSDAKSAAALAGTSLRTLQRTTVALTGRAPLFWIRLARVRRAAIAVQAGATAIEAATALGFTDQPHMSREFRHWLGVTPGQVARRDPITSGLDSSGFATSPQ